MLIAPSTSNPTALLEIMPPEAEPATTIPRAVICRYSLAFEIAPLFLSPIDRKTTPKKKLTIKGPTIRSAGPCINAITRSNEVASRPGAVIAYANR
jgi:hypothetical protein